MPTIDKVRVEVEATAKGASNVIRNLESRIKELKKALNSVDTSKLRQAQKVQLDTTGMSKSEREITDSVNKIKQAYAGLQSYTKAGLMGDKSSLVSSQRGLIKLQSQIDTLQEKLRQAGDNRSGINIDTDSLQSARTELAEIQEAVKQTQGQVGAAVKDMNSKNVKPNTNGAKKDMDDLASRAKKAAVSLAQLTAKGISNGFKNLRSGIGKIRSALSSISDRATKGVRTGFMKILRYGFGIRSLYVLFRRLKEAIKDSFGALQSSGAMFEETRANINSLKNALLTLKFQFGAAFEPIFNAIAPALQTLINYLISVMNTISAFTAKLMGRSTYSKVAQVMSNTGSAAGGAAKNVKELNHQLQGFDELNNLTLDPGNSGGGGGGGAGGGAGAMYEEASVNSVLGDFAKELAENIRAGNWFEVGRAISDKLSEVMESIPWDSIYEKARNFGKGLADFLNGLITPRLFGNLGKTIAGALNTVFEAGGSFAKEFDWNNLGESLGTGLTEFFKTANFGQWGETVHDWVCGILDAGIALLQNTDFDVIADKLVDFFNGLNIGDIASKLMTFGKLLVSAIAQVIQRLWQDASAKEKLGAAIVGLIAVAHLSGLSGVLGKAIVKAIMNGGAIKLASSGLGKLTLSFVGVAVAIEGGRVIGNRIGQVIASLLNDDELLRYYQKYTSWKGMFKEIYSALKDGSFWDGMADLMNSGFGNVLRLLNPVLAYNLDFFSNTKANDKNHKNNNIFNGGVGKLEDKIKVKLQTELEGDIKNKNDLKDTKSNWMELINNFKSKDSKLESSMLGAFTSVETVKEGADNFRSLDRDFRSKNATYTTTMGGQITSKEQIDSVRTQYENLYNAWNGKESRFDVTTGGQLDKFGTLDTWKTKFTNLFNSWLGRSATMSANVGGQMNKIGDTDTWVGKIKNLINNWVGKTANFNAGFNQTQGTIAGYADQMQRLAGSWTSRNAEFNLSANITSDNLNEVARDLADAINRNLRETKRRVYINANGGIITSSGKHSIPQYAGGTTDALSHGSLFIAGERGSEIVGNINGRTEVLNRSQIAATIKASTISGMRLFKNSQMVRPSDITSAYASNSPYGYENRAMTTSNEAILEQNRLLQEQNTLLREIANKELTVSTRDVFDATKKEANIYYERTGNSPFLY